MGGGLRYIILNGLIGLLMLAGLAYGESSDVAAKRVTAVWTDERPVLDGRLDEELWKRAAVISDFHEISPNEFEPASEETRFYVIYGRNALYIGAEFNDREADRIVARVMRQGDFSEGEDGLGILLDTFNNGRSGYFFQLTPNAIRGDGLFRNVTDLNWDWDSIWDAATQIHDKGWTAEIAIPFNTLSFNPQDDTWGINFSRTIGRRKEDIGWVSYNRSQNPANSGKIVGLTGMEQGLGLDLAVGARASRLSNYSTINADVTSNELEPTVDIFYKPDPSLTAALTVNTDFSGTTADARRLNLTRFSVFFPEQRNFFLQDNDIFEFGRIGGPRESGSVSQAFKESGRPFFSRRIGLSADGRAIDIDGGLKVTGRIGGWEYGVLNIAQGEYEGVDSSNLFVGRVSKNVLAESTLGLIMTSGNPTGNEDNGLIGLDFRYLNTRLPNGKMLEGSAWYQESRTDGLDGDEAAAGFSLSAPNTEGLWGEMNYRQIEKNFNPALGFVSETGVGAWFVKGGFRWRPQNSKFRVISSEAKLQRVDQLDGGFDRQIISADFLSLENHSGDDVKLFATFYREDLSQPFKVADGVIIPPGQYEWNRYCTRGGTGQHRTLRFSGYVCNGGYYDGNGRSTGINFIWRPNKHVKIQTGYTLNNMKLPYGEFRNRLYSLRADIAFNATWYWENFVQYDNVSDSMGLNSIMRWIPVAGREFLLVLNRDFVDFDETRSFVSRSSDFTAKFAYTFRF